MVLNCIHSVVGAASSRDEPRQRETDAIVVAESRSHEVATNVSGKMWERLSSRD